MDKRNSERKLREKGDMKGKRRGLGGTGREW
jgi:hypothetical protein